MTATAGSAVVVGIDGSPRGLEAVELAATEAAMRHRRLHIVHAFIWSTVGTAFTPGRAGPALQAFQDQARAFLVDAADRARSVAPGVPTTTELVTGSAASVLLDQSRHAGLLVVGARGFGGFAGLLVGSVAVQVSAHGSCPVLVARGRHRGNGPVVVGIDGSRTSVLALEFAIEEAALRETELVALHAWNGATSTELNDSLPMTYEFWSNPEEGKRVLAEALAGVAERYPDVPIRRQVTRGSARHLLADWSRSAQLVVVGDRGHGGFAGLMLGSVSQHLIYRATCPTAVVRPALIGAGRG